MKILGIDPGKTTGWGLVTFGEDGHHTAIKFGTSKDPNLLDILDLILEADHIVYENFFVRPNQARRGSFDWDPMVTPQVIGALKLLCHQHGKPISEQSPSVKPVGYGFASLNYKKGKKGTHEFDALAHAFYCAVKNFGLKPVLKQFDVDPHK